MLRSVALVRTDVSEERIASINRMTRIGTLGTTLAVTSNKLFIRNVLRMLVTDNVPSAPIFVTLMTEAIRFSEHRFLQELHCVTSQKTAIFIATAVKTSSLT
jgi:hypothetical protein